MSNQDIIGLPRSYGNSLPQFSRDSLLYSSQCKIVFLSLRNDGTKNCLFSTIPPPPHVTPPMSRFPQVERYETTQAFLTCKHEYGMCAYVLKMKLYIDKSERMGVVFPKEKSIDLVLISLPKSYGQFFENFHMENLHVTLTELTEMLIVVKVEMFKNTIEAEILIGSNPRFPWTLTMVKFVINNKFLFPIERNWPRSNPLTHSKENG